ncbi:dihydrofolate reductase family protein [Nonomuraea sp. LP-02]|uniref:dihydrofolate reductase family protein n=1 Tax=Nonomuraea sp. LP-02 TaxID=3097960 RepID=UPI002E33DC3B|nr:dihydrofolate reductase family protein [Nonomuraea sp. LP-02]MED7925220.1 dihydrofolate reductase family protein [Nonomuraea sp. LP-02]
MGTISVFVSVSLDGVMQGPGRADEDTRGGFRHGGWGAGYADQVIGKYVAEQGGAAAMLFGRRTYDDVLGYWTSVGEPNPFTETLVNTPKYVASRRPDTVLAHPNSTLLAGEAAGAVAGLKERVDGVIRVLGSGELVRSLHAAGLVEEYVLLTHPIVLGSGTRLFGEGERTGLELQEAITATTGVVIARYRTN